MLESCTAVNCGNVGHPQRRLRYYRVTQMPERKAFISLNLDYSLTVFPAVSQKHLGLLQDLRRHSAVASVKKRYGKVLKEPTSSPTQSEQPCFAIELTLFSNNIYLGVKVKASKQLCLKIC